MDVIVEDNGLSIERKLTGLYSFDAAVSSRGVRGIPLPAVLELYGRNHVGKSTISYFLSGAVAGEGNIEICDIETASSEYIATAVSMSGFKGTVHLIDSFKDGDIRSHEAMADEGLHSLWKNPKTSAFILDSVGAFASIYEVAGDTGEAIMGRRAKAVAQIARKATMYTKNKSPRSITIFVNHVHSVLGGHGHTTAGGETVKYLASLRIMLYPKATITNSKDDTLGYQVAGSIEKMRFGGRGGSFQFITVPNMGVSVPMTAVYDASDLKLIDRGSVVKIDGKSIGRITSLFEAAASGKTKIFEPVFEKLEEYYGQQVLGVPENLETKDE